jgi:hypothetical protein
VPLGLVRKVRKSLRQVGLLGTLGRAARKVWKKAVEQLPAHRRARRLKEEQDRAFDRQHNVQTAGFVPLDGLNIGTDNRDHGFPYDPIEPEKFQRSVGSVALRHEDFVFIDFGSGKGKSVLLASELPFKKVIGVEFAPELHRVAEENARTFRSERQRCRDIEMVCGDAAAYTLPPVPVVLFLFNPFGREVMERVIENFKKSYKEHPRELYVVYATPVLDDLWGAVDFLVKVASQKEYCSVYKTR